MSLNLPRIPNKDFDFLTKELGVSLDRCPTCGAKPIEVLPGVTGWINGTYRYRGEVHDCDCDTQKLLHKHYLLAGIGDQYQRLDWRDYRGPDSIKDMVATYLDGWESFKVNGMGIEFSSPRLGVGKTFGATYVGKELVKKGERVYFTPFLDVIGILTRQARNWELLEGRLYDASVLILDEIVPPTSTPQRDLFHGKFEELIRNRTNYNRVTITTTNIEDHKLHEIYPRPYSLLSAKQVPIDMGRGDDARQNHISDENLEISLNHEVRPIT